MNLCVNCKLGTTFLSSKEALDDAHIGQYIFDYVNECIEDIGHENVVQSQGCHFGTLASPR